MRIYLIGFMAAGKSTVGAALAERLRYPLRDLDREIESRAGCAVAEIFDRDGEDVFRDLEHAALLATAELDDAVVATGGGVMSFERNRRAIRRLGVSVWLKPSLETVLERLRWGGRSRPLYRDEAQVRELYHDRVAGYGAADFIIESSLADSPTEVAGRIVAELREQQCVI